MRTSFVFGVSAVILLGGVAMAQPAPPAPPRAPGAEMPPPPPPGPGPRHDMAPPPPPKGAHFKLRIDEQRVDVKCADDEPMKACADIVMQMADRVFGPRSAPAPRP